MIKHISMRGNRVFAIMIISLGFLFQSERKK